jgi:hypothetical protein
MTTIQIVGIAVAAAIVAVLVAALIVTRDKGKQEDETAMTAPPPPPGESFLDQQPSDSFDRLGRPEIVVADQQVDKPRIDWGSQTEDAALPGAESAAPAEAVEESATTGPMEAAGEPASAAGGSTKAETAPADEASPTYEAPHADEAPPARESKLVPLSDIIVTTSNKMVDITDPEVRRMLRDLIKYEIDQAAQFKEQGQNIDAALQLTEAVKICEALDMSSQARLIRAMMKELQV